MNLIGTKEGDSTVDYQRQLTELEKLRGVLTERLKGLDSEVLNRRPSSGGWSPAQVLAHVIEAESRSLAYLRKKTRQPDAIPKSGWVESCKSALLNLIMRSRIKVSAPPGAGEVPESAELSELQSRWDEVRSNWRGFVAEFPEELAERAVYRHPVMGRLSLEQTLRFLAEHLRRHTRQIDRVLRESA